MAGDAGTRGAAEIHAEIHAVGFVKHAKGGFDALRELHDFAERFGVAGGQIRNVSVGNDHDVARSVGIAVEDHERFFAAMDDQGFFVKLGDGAADIKPIAHLYKSQVYQLAEYLGVPAQVRKRPPTTDTYSLYQGQDEFYFSLPYDKMDLCLYGKTHGIPADTVAGAISLTPEQVQRVYKDIDVKRRSTRYLHLKPKLMDDLNEIEEA